MVTSKKAPRNRTITLDETEKDYFSQKLITINRPVEVEKILNRTIQQDLFTVIDKLPDAFVDLLFIDPPYNLSKTFNSNQFQKTTDDNYEAWLDSWLNLMLRILKPTASVYICGDWVSSSAIYRVMSQYLKVRNRITWEREKGRGAKSNWKNCSEDIWFGTVSDNYYFNPDAVKLKKKVIAPYKVDGQPKDWQEEKQGNYRLTHPSNLWSDITVPFWSMPENTDHPTQKPEKLLAKIILASSQEGDVIFDPFLGVGTTSVVAKKLNRNYSGIEIDPDYACLAEKRLKIAEEDQTIQGYADGVFWERNSLPRQSQTNQKSKKKTFSNQTSNQLPLINE